jgi:hypothetical protein
MTLEYAQILATALQMRGFAHTEIYKPTHTTHPCVHWAAESYGNYNWLWDLFSMTASEYTFRFGKTHQSWFTQAPIISPIRNRFNHLWENEKNQHMTPWAQCMPDQYKAPSAVDAYRAYYCGEKARFARYTRMVKAFGDLYSGASRPWTLKHTQHRRFQSSSRDGF